MCEVGVGNRFEVGTGLVNRFEDGMFNSCEVFFIKTAELALLLSPGSNRKNEERLCVYENCSKVYAESTSTSRVLANHLKVEHNVIKPSFEDSDSEFENITSPKVIRVLDNFSINDKTLSVTTDIASNMVCFGEMFCCANENRMHIRCALHILHLIFQTGLENESISHLFEKIPTQDLSYDKQVCVSRYLKQPAINITEDIDILKWWDNNQNLKKKV
ncbi:hypothetical protein BpHYR1_036374 [Brachionus plicatilis]|uniref:Uncharacterized protein n=1 Tax=Brachionus plicatilis TaxID=10195 RepID=A0A3M7PS75_BRAPC|nr:hypothetical protein BpHYR1_036374 [Brachionus plicatilis]